MNKNKKPSFREALAMMTKGKDNSEGEAGFHWLVWMSKEHVNDLIEAFNTEQNELFKPMLLEIIAESKAPEALTILAAHVANEDALLRSWAIHGLCLRDTREGRKILWDAQSYAFADSVENARFHLALKCAQ